MGVFQSLPTVYPGGTSDGFTTPFPIALGTKARDLNGYEYVLCQTGTLTTVAPEMAVTIGADWIVTPVGSSVTGQRGSLGVVADLGKSGNTSAPVSAIPTSTSVWVQVYGRAYVQIGLNASSPSDAANGPTTVHTSLLIKFTGATSAATPIGVLGLVSDQLPTSSSNWVVRGMYVATDASPAAEVSIVTAVSATHIGSHVAVWLNYPYIAYEELSS